MSRIISDMIYIIGHKNPDTDSIVSAMVMADYFNKLGQKAKPARAGKINKETEFVLKLANAKPPSLVKSLSDKQVFLVDHNEFSQAGEGIERAEIIGAIDHHKLGGIKNDKPIYFRIEPLGSTSALIFKLFEENNFKLSRNQAFILLCAIISDTLKFNSPTTTNQDIEIAKELAGICIQNINNLADAMFKAKSEISGIKLQDLILLDYKKFNEQGTEFGIGVCETVMPETIIAKKQEILELLLQIKKQKKLGLIFFAVVDIIKQQTHLFIASEQEKIIAEKGFQKKTQESVMILPGIVSRKKQIAPAIINAL